MTDFSKAKSGLQKIDDQEIEIYRNLKAMKKEIKPRNISMFNIFLGGMHAAMNTGKVRKKNASIAIERGIKVYRDDKIMQELKNKAAIQIAKSPEFQKIRGKVAERHLIGIRIANLVIGIIKHNGMITQLEFLKIGDVFIHLLNEEIQRNIKRPDRSALDKLGFINPKGKFNG